MQPPCNFIGSLLFSKNIKHSQEKVRSFQRNQKNKRNDQETTEKRNFKLLQREIRDIYLQLLSDM